LKLPAPDAGNATAEPMSTPDVAPTDDLDFGGGEDTQPNMEEPTAPSSDKPFDDEPFDAGVEANEEDDPKKFIQQLSGKLGQSLRKYSETQGQPDLELEKFAINSLISATHTADMDEEDRTDIIKKINKAGSDDSKDSEGSDMDVNNDEPSGDNGSGDGDNPDGGDDFSGFDSEGEEGLDELHVIQEIDKDNPSGCLPDGNMFIDAKKNSMFAPEGSKEYMPQNKMTENLSVNSKNSIFGKNFLKEKLQETFKIEDMTEPMTEPIVKPEVKPSETQPSRRNRPFEVEPDTVPAPAKALNEGTTDFQVYHNSFSSAVQTAQQYVEARGYTLDEQEWFNRISTGPRKPQEGETNSYTLTLYKDGKEQRKSFHIQIYGMRDRYELNAYIS
jgi:hypothetical protein